MKKYWHSSLNLIRSFDLHDFFSSGELRLLATSLSFTSILSIIPFLAVVLATFQFVGGLDFLYPKVEGILLEYFKETTGTNVGLFLKSSLQKIHAGALGSTGILFLLWTSFGLLRDVETAFNRIWHVKSSRPIYSRILLYWLILMAAPILLAVLAGFKSFRSAQALSQFVDQDFLIGFFLFWGLWLLYKIIPDTKVSSRYSFYGALFSTVALSIVQQSFSWVAITFFRYNKIYGSIAAVPLVLIWLLVVWHIILLGCHISFFLQRRPSYA